MWSSQSKRDVLEPHRVHLSKRFCSCIAKCSRRQEWLRTASIKSLPSFAFQFGTRSEDCFLMLAAVSMHFCLSQYTHREEGVPDCRR